MPTPTELGFFMPAEWERHKRCWMAWPSREPLWGDCIEEARRAFTEVARTIADFEPVTMICNPADAADVSLACGAGVDVLPLGIDDSWMRDFGPTFLVDRQGSLAGVHWRFNAWGNKYQDYEQDAALARRVLERVGARPFEAPIVLEGGAIHVDGEGTLLATEQSLLNPNRNPDIGHDRMERHLKDYLGVEKVIWLAGGLEEDETDGHVDNVACFAQPGTVLALITADKGDGNYEVLQENLRRLRSATDARGRQLQVVELAQPSRRRHKEMRLPLSYVNLYIANGAVIVPAFEAPEDDKAYRALRDVFPNRRIVPVVANDIVIGGGGIHCITQQQPAA
jgi:agmatine deiminase